jgi:hypothetical protein
MRCPKRNKWIKKSMYSMYVYIYTHTYTTEYYLAIKKNENCIICRKMDGNGDHCAEISQTQKAK